MSRLVEEFLEYKIYVQFTLLIKFFIFINTCFSIAFISWVAFTFVAVNWVSWARRVDVTVMIETRVHWVTRLTVTWEALVTVTFADLLAVLVDSSFFRGVRRTRDYFARINVRNTYVPIALEAIFALTIIIGGRFGKFKRDTVCIFWTVI